MDNLMSKSQEPLLRYQKPRSTAHKLAVLLLAVLGFLGTALGLAIWLSGLAPFMGVLLPAMVMVLVGWLLWGTVDKVTLDKSSGQVEVTSGSAISQHRKRIPISTITRISVRPQYLSPGDSEGRDAPTYAVKLEGASEEESLQILLDNRSEAHQAGRRFSEFLLVPLRDTP